MNAPSLTLLDIFSQFGSLAVWHFNILGETQMTSDRPRQPVLGSAETETENKIGRDLGREPRPRYDLVSK